ncbi:MAG: hypothetical protein QM784_29860 [Polyangiaceae bacterium]
MLAVPLVAIEIPVGVATELSSATLRACNLALGSGRCALADGPRGGQGNAWVAQILLDESAPNQFRIDLQDAVPQTTLTSLTRTLAFDGTELSAHRWSTAGVVVAALVISAESAIHDGPFAAPRGTSDGEDPERSRAPQDHSPPTVATPDRQKNPRSDTFVPSTGLRFRFDLGGLAGPGIEAGAWRAGALVRPSIPLGRWVFLWTSLSGTTADQSVRAFWWSGAVGVGFGSTRGNVRFGELGLEARLGWRGERLGVTAREDGREDSAQVLRTGPVLGLELRSVLTPRLALWLSGESAVLFPRVDTQVAGARIGHVGTLDTTVGFGLRVHLGDTGRQ